MLLEEEEHAANRKPTSSGKVIFWIVLMNVVFSFDSILSAMAFASIKDSETGARISDTSFPS